MKYHYFRINVVTRIVAILLLGYSGIYVLTQTHFWLVSFWLFLALILTLLNLIRYVEKSRRELAYFLLSIKQGDFTNTYPYLKKEDLNYAFHEVNRVMKNLSSEKASNYQYLQTVVEHIRVAIICFDEDFKIELLNKAARDLFHKQHITSINTIGVISPELSEAIKKLHSGERELVKIHINGETHNLSILATTFKLQTKEFKLVSFQDIKSELEAKEIESWQKLIRVLTHEIKNSVIPISTLSEVLIQVLHEQKPLLSEIQNGEIYNDIVGGLETIESRSKGLASFVKTYDQLTKVPKPEFQEVTLKSLSHRIHQLFKVDLERDNIQLSMLINDDCMINADPNLVDQVLINLLKNAMDALRENSHKRIQLLAIESENHINLHVKDNGSGIPPEVLENIFVPFYSTKKLGSGIGLSLSRQIMKLHGGSLSVESSKEQGTTFTLRFRKV